MMMRKYLLIFLLLIAGAAGAQAPNIIYGKDVRISTRDTSSAELTIINSTRNVLGFFKNIGGGTGRYTIITQADVAGLSDSLLIRYTKAQADARFKAIAWVPSWADVTGKPTNFSTTYALSNDVQDSILIRLKKADSLSGGYISWLLAKKKFDSLGAAKQNTLVSGTNIKTVNGTNLLGSGDVSISGMIYPAAGIPLSTGTAWGTSITDNSSNWNTAFSNRITSITNTGSSGASTLSSNVLNIPNYTLSGLGGMPIAGGTFTGGIIGTSASFASLNGIATNGIALNVENNSTGFSAAQFKNIGSGNIAQFSNNGGVVATIGNGGGITAGASIFSTSTVGTLAGNFKNNITSASGSTGYGLLIESEASAASSYALTVRNLSGSNTYLSIPTETGRVGNVGIGTATPDYKLDVVGSVRVSTLPSFTSGGTYIVSNSGILSSRTAAELRTDISAISFSDSTTILSGRWLPNRSLDTAMSLQARIQTKSPIAGSSSITTVGTLASGSIPYSLITGTPTIPTNANFVDLTTTQNSIAGNKGFTGNVGIGQSANGSFGLAVANALPSYFTSTSNATSATYGGSVFLRQTNTVGNGNGISLSMNNASSSPIEYAYIGSVIEGNTAGSENGAFIIAPQFNGARTQRVKVGPTGEITASNLSGTGTRMVVADASGVLSTQALPSGTASSGTYTPTITNQANITSSTAQQLQWMRVGNTVTVSGGVLITPTTSGVTTILRISLPVSSNFSNSWSCGGGGGSGGVNGLAVYGDTGNKTANLGFQSASTSSTQFYFSFTYLVE
jgi:hypothetical protein